MPDLESVGIPQLDRMLSPIPLGAQVAFANDPGIDAEPFLYQSAHQHLADGRTVVYAVFNRPPSAVRRALNEFGFDTADSSRLLFLDGYSPLMGSTENAAYELKIPDAQELVGLLEQIVLERPDSILILDGLTALVDQASPEKVLPQFQALDGAFRRFRLGLALLTRWPYGDDFDRLLKPFDAAISVKGVENRVTLNQYFVIERARWRENLQPRPVLYRVMRPGGVFVYIPKIVVTGPYHAGKSTFVQTLSDAAVSVNRLGTTVALDHGHVTLDGLTADIFGTPGQERFDPLLKTISGQALGVIVVVDSTRPDSFARAREMMELTGKQGLPMIVAANKQDIEGALPPAEVAKRLGTPPHIHVIGCVGQDRESSRHVLHELIEQIMTKVVH